MPAPTIVDLPVFPSRLNPNTTWEAQIGTWWEGVQSSFSSWNAFYTWVTGNAPGSIGAFALDTLNPVSLAGDSPLSSSAFGKLHVCSGTTANYTVTLPAVYGNAGKLIGIRVTNDCTKLVTIDGNASELIDGALTRVMWSGESAVLLCDGTGWSKIAGNTIPMICRIYASAIQSIPSGIVTKTTLDTYGINVGRMGNTGNNQIVIMRTGNYQITGTAAFSNSIAYKHYIIVGGSAYVVSPTQANDGYSSPTCGVMSANAGYVVYQSVVQSTGTAQNTYINSFPCSLSVVEVPQW